MLQSSRGNKGAPVMAENAALELVQEVYRRFAAGDMAFVMDSLSDDVAWSSSGPAERLPTAQARKGKEGVANYFEALQQTWRVEGHEAKEFFARGDRVVVRTVLTAICTGTARSAEIEKIDLLTVRDGKIASFQELFDASKLLACLDCN
jgi:ketosteroid isomerase-like protein